MESSHISDPSRQRQDATRSPGVTGEKSLDTMEAELDEAIYEAVGGEKPLEHVEQIRRRISAEGEREHAANIKRQNLKALCNEWRRYMERIDIMLEESVSIDVLKEQRAALLRARDEVVQGSEELLRISPEESFEDVIEGIRRDTTHTVCAIGERIRRLIGDTKSTISGKSRSSKSSVRSTTSIKAKAMAKAAELETSLKYLDKEQAMKTQLERFKMEKKLAMTKARVEAMEKEELQHDDQYLDDLPHDTSRVEDYVETQANQNDVATGHLPPPPDQLREEATTNVSSEAAPFQGIPSETAGIAGTNFYAAGNHQNTRMSMPTVSAVSRGDGNPYSTSFIPTGQTAAAAGSTSYAQQIQGTQNPLYVTGPAYGEMNIGPNPPVRHPFESHQIFPGVHLQHQHAQNRPSDFVDLMTEIRLSRYPIPEPPAFDGDPLRYPAWRSAFITLIESRGIPNCEKVHYLKRYVVGKAQECVEGYFLLSTEEAYIEAMNKLERRFGNPFVLGQAFREKLDKWEKISPNDGNALRCFSDYLRQCETAMHTISNLFVLNDSHEIQRLQQKLPLWLSTKWKTQAYEHQELYQSFPSFSNFVSFVEKQAEIMCNPATSYAVESTSARNPRNNKPNARRSSMNKQTFMTKTTNDEKGNKSDPRGQNNQTEKNISERSQRTQETTDRSTKRPCFLCNNKDHHIDKCPQFLEKTLEDRKQYAKSQNLCFACLNPKHLAKNCKYKKRCRICGRRHPTSLHDDSMPSKNSDTAKAATREEPVSVSSSLVISHLSVSKEACKSAMIVPVFVSHRDRPRHEHLVYALLDTQSDASFITATTCRALGIDGPAIDLCLSTMSAEEQIIQCKKITGIQLRGHNCEKIVNLPEAYTTETIPANRDHIPDPQSALKWPHLSEVAKELMPISDNEIGLLIGYNCSKALFPREVIEAPDDGPFAQKTDLGWGIIGIIEHRYEPTDAVAIVHRIATKVVEPLQLQTNSSAAPSNKAFFSTKNANVKEIKCPVDLLNLMDSEFSTSNGIVDSKRSIEDTKFLKQLENGVIKKKDGHFALPLPMKGDKPELPNNRIAAERRLQGLKKRLLKDERYRHDYLKFMDNIIKKGFAERCVDAPPPKRVWYLPHHGIYHPRKKKLRVVFDASAKHGGISLNDILLQGPDMTNTLLGVLCRFRQEPVAVTCDIEQMFHQFQVLEGYRDYLRFLWFEDNFDEPKEFRMTVHLFGATSSPGVANFGLKRTAEEGKEKFGSKAATFIKENFYVDDGLTSVETEKEAIDLISNAVAICAESGIRLHKIASNSRKVMEAIPTEERATDLQSLDLLRDKDIVERTLGVEWSIKNDVFQFRIVLKDRPPTRRGILSSVSTVYDPLGLLAPVILKGRRILQDICLNEFDWDSPLSDEFVTRWESWKSELFQLEKLQIARCFKPAGFGKVISAQLHHFSDASNIGYGQCSYIRLVDSSDRIHCTLVMAKSRVTPIRPITVPRLELTAAVLSVKVGRFLRNELSYENIEEFYWSDSEVVLGYVANEAKRFQVFVANRIALIREHTVPSQWRYVSSQENPADIASRGTAARTLLECPVWFRGPDFLWQKDLPLENLTQLVPSDDPELKKVQSRATAAEEKTKPFSERWSKFSSWWRLVKAIALCLRYKNILQTKVKSKIDKEASQPLVNSNVELVKRAEIAIINSVQSENFAEEITALKEERNIKCKSPLSKLDPFLDENDTLRVGGRLGRAHLPYEIKHPIILPKSCHVSTLVARFHHEKSHQGRGMTVSAIREAGFWIIGCRKIVSRVISKCLTCRKFRGRLQEQKMAPLPEDRLENTAPFTYCAVDYFGPFLIRIKRSDVPRYGVIFTCLYSRAIHLEVAPTMETDAFINALRRFIAIRGPIRTLRSDRGTNFVGAKNELERELNNMDHNRVKSFLLGNGCDYFHFRMNVPKASHMGGSWERLIRTVRNVLTPMLEKIGTQLDDDTIHTLFYEVAAIVNSRPLSVCDLYDPLSSGILTPNQLITMKTKIVLPPPGNFTQPDLYSRKRWRRIQYVLNIFWSKWKTEYLTELQNRKKWKFPKRDMKPGDIVLLKEDDQHRNAWPIAIVDDVYPSEDGHIRKVKLRVADSHINDKGVRVKSQSVLERPIHKCVLLMETD